MDRVTARWWAVGAFSNLAIAVGWLAFALTENKLYAAFMAIAWVAISASNFAAWYTTKQLDRYRDMIKNAR